MSPKPVIPTGESGAVYMPDRPRRASGDRARRRLLDAGRHRFAREGYAGTKVGDLVSDAGVTAPVLYHHFGSKRGLFVAVADEVYTRFVGEFRASLDGRTDFGDALNAALDCAARLHEADPTLSPMAFAAQIEVLRDEDLGHALRPTLQSFRALVGDLAALASPRITGRAGQTGLFFALIAILNGMTSVAVSVGKPDSYALAVASLQTLINTSRTPP